MQRNGIIRVAGHDVDARVKVAARESESHVITGRDAELLSGGRTDHHGVVPGKPRNGLRGFLQPGVVRELAVANRRIGTEDGLERVWITARGC